MISTLVLMALGQFYSPTPLPYYNPAGYHRRHPEWVGPYVSGVGNPKTIELPGAEQLGRIERVDFDRQLITLRLPTETVALHYGLGTRWDGTYEDLKPGTILSFNQVKHRITIIGGQSGSRKRD